MKWLMIFSLLILCGSAAVGAEIYTWTDDKGTVTFTDNPARIPASTSNRTRSGEHDSIRPPTVRKAPRKQGNKKLQAIIPENRTNSKAAAEAKQKQVPLERQSEIKGHLGGDQTDPAPPSMKQPKAEPLGDQPKPTPPGMKQPIPAESGDQPKQTPDGMKQPAPAPLGDQPKPTSPGMEQPDSKL